MEAKSARKGRRGSSLSASSIILLLSGSFVAIAFTLGAFIVWLTNAGFVRPEFTLPMLVIGSVTALMLSLAGTAIIFRRLGLEDRSAAMGLPEGSIRAIIALMLIVIFAVISVFLVSYGGRSAPRVLEGLTVQQADAYTSSDVISRELMGGAATDQDARYRVTVNIEDKAATAMSQELLTTLGTLVVAVASFYFGSQSGTTSRQRSNGASKDDQKEGVPSTTSVVPEQDMNASRPDV